MALHLKIKLSKWMCKIFKYDESVYDSYDSGIENWCNDYLSTAAWTGNRLALAQRGSIGGIFGPWNIDRYYHNLRLIDFICLYFNSLSSAVISGICVLTRFCIANNNSIPSTTTQYSFLKICVLYKKKNKKRQLINKSSYSFIACAIKQISMFYEICCIKINSFSVQSVSYTHLRAHET